MTHTTRHHHCCADCGIPTACDGAWEDNWDGFPDVICAEFHLAGGRTDPDFVCDTCARDREDAAIADLQAEVGL